MDGNDSSRTKEKTSKSHLIIVFDTVNCWTGWDKFNLFQNVTGTTIVRERMVMKKIMWTRLPSKKESNEEGNNLTRET